ncbi:MAG: hypothetical protein WDW38_011356 [Sanguina aurantia]
MTHSWRFVALKLLRKSTKENAIPTLGLQQAAAPLRRQDDFDFFDSGSSGPGLSSGATKSGRPLISDRSSVVAGPTPIYVSPPRPKPRTKVQVSRRPAVTPPELASMDWSESQAPAPSPPLNSDDIGFSLPLQRLLQRLRRTSLSGSVVTGGAGFDPLNFYDSSLAGPRGQRWSTYSEVIHGRWALLGVTGCVLPELLASLDIIPSGPGIPWFTAFSTLPSTGLEGDQFDSNPTALLVPQVCLLGVLELRRLQDWRAPGSRSSRDFLGLERYFYNATGDPMYPGGPVFNGLRWVENPASVQQYKEVEIAAGRLAMLAFLGFAVQAAVTHVGPVQNLSDHLRDPLRQNVGTNLARLLLPH